MNQDNFTNRDIIKIWAAHAHESTASFDEDGDFARKHLLNPSIFSLLGSIEGKTILDAGCGNGYLSRLLANRGAVVTGIDPALIHLCAEAGDTSANITYMQEDLSGLLDIHPELANSFDIVVSNMVLQDIPDCDAAIQNCVGALKLGGSFLLSIVHPCFEESGKEWQEKGFVAVHEYFEFQTIRQARFGVMFHRPLSFYFNTLIENGCNLLRIVEPRLGLDAPVPMPESHRDRHVPSFLIIQAIRSDNGSGCS